VGDFVRAFRVFEETAMKAAPGLLAALVAAAPMHSQSEAVPSPADKSARTAPVAYESAFVGYRKASDDPPAPWKAVNSDVAPSASKKDTPPMTDPKAKTQAKRASSDVKP
jgi:hypothetical protein